MSDPVPAVAEAAATGETAAIFADIRQVLGVEVVNLIWRHLATMPGALPWAWGQLRPLYADGTVAAEASALHADLGLPRLPAFPPEALAAAALDDTALAAIRDVLAAYNRTNAMAMVALSALLQRLDGSPSAAQAAAAPRSPAPPEPPDAIALPPLPSLAQLAPAVATLVLTLNRLGTRRQDAVLASMYRHLAYWPTYLALAWTLIAPLDADGSLDRAIADATRKAQARAAGIVTRLQNSAAAPVDPALAAAIRSAIEPFAGDVIVKMVVICAVLRAAT